MADILHTALTAPHPNNLYTGDWSTATMETFIRLAPEGLLDWMRRRMQHLEGGLGLPLPALGETMRPIASFRCAAAARAGNPGRR